MKYLTRKHEKDAERNKMPAGKAENRRTDELTDAAPGFMHRFRRTAGNEAVVNRLRNRGLQPKLTVSQPDDVHEREADRTADEVMRMPDADLQRQPLEEEEEKLQTKPAAAGTNFLARKQAVEEEEELKQGQLQRRAAGTEEFSEVLEADGGMRDAGPTVEGRINALRGGGQPLPDDVRAYMEPRFGADFSPVRVHADAEAAETAGAVHALAFTVGSDIVFGQGRYEPATPAGKKLLAHELTHVVQQGAQGDKVQRLSDPDCSSTTRMPLASGCRRGFVNTCYSETVVPASSTAMTVDVSVDYLTPPGPIIEGKEDFSVQVYKCRWWHDQLIGSKRISGTLPDTVRFAIARVTPGDKYYIKIYSRSNEPLTGSYSLSQ